MNSTSSSPSPDRALRLAIAAIGVVLVAHGGVLRAFLRSAFGEEVLPGTRRAPNASITRLRWSPAGEPELLDLASTTHLDDLPV